MRTVLILLCLTLLHCASKPPEPRPIPPPPTGAISGVVRFNGKPPAPQRISMIAEEDCDRLHKSPVYDQPVVVAKDGGLANAFVYIKQGLEGKKFPPATTTVTLEQKGCQFLPRVLGLQVGQTLAVRNSDPVSHNVHPQPHNNRDWNQHQSPGAPDIERRFGFPEVMIPVKCNIHKWMKSYIAVLDHPFAQVTPAHGAFRIGDVPPGSYTLAVWHEVTGESLQTIVVPPGGEAVVSFSLADPAKR